MSTTLPEPLIARITRIRERMLINVSTDKTQFLYLAQQSELHAKEPNQHPHVCNASSATHEEGWLATQLKLNVEKWDAVVDWDDGFTDWEKR